MLTLYEKVVKGSNVWVGVLVLLYARKEVESCLVYFSFELEFAG